MEATETMQVKLVDPNGAANDTIFVLGATGCGKTTVIANKLLTRKRFVIIDVKSEYPAAFFGSDVVVCTKLAEFSTALNSGKNRIIFRFPPLTEDDETTLDKVCFQLLHFQFANKHLPITLGMDELNRFVKPMSCPRGLYEVILRGRAPYNIQKIFGGQWFNHIPIWCRETFSEIYVFSHYDKAGLSTLSSYGFDPVAVSQLEPYSVLHKSKHGIKHVKITVAGKQ